MLSHLYVLEEWGGDQSCQRGESKAKEVRKKVRGCGGKDHEVGGVLVLMGHGQDTWFYSICDEKPLENMKEENISFTFSEIFLQLLC